VKPIGPSPAELLAGFLLLNQLYRLEREVADVAAILRSRLRNRLAKLLAAG
jgi:hypothetical protein